jgi:CheY-like chemotaxis protein
MTNRTVVVISQAVRINPHPRARGRSFRRDFGPIVPARRLLLSRSMASLLIIDDEWTVVDTFSRMLRLEGYQVYTATTAEDGLAEAERHTPDAVILDLRMPLVDGLEFLRRFRARATLRDTPVVIVTGDYLIDDATTLALDRLGASVVFKPLWLDDLVKIASKLLGARDKEHVAAAGSHSEHGESMMAV